MRTRNMLQGAGEILFPLFLYYLLNMVVPAGLALVWEKLVLEEYVLWLLTAVNCCLIPVFAWMYRGERIRKECLCLEQGKKPCWKRKYGLKEIAFAILGAICISRGVNLFLGLTFLPRYFTGYETARAEIYESSLFSQIAASVLSAPVLEELLMRGVIYTRIRRLYSSPRAAVLGSALIFGLFHGNVVQGIYAFFLGLFFAQVYERCDSLIPAFAAHSAANGATLLAVYLPFFHSSASDLVSQEIAAAVYLLTGACFVKYFCD